MIRDHKKDRNRCTQVLTLTEYRRRYVSPYYTFYIYDACILFDEVQTFYYAIFPLVYMSFPLSCPTFITWFYLYTNPLLMENESAFVLCWGSNIKMGPVALVAGSGIILIPHDRPYQSVIYRAWSVGRFKNVYKLINLRAPKFWILNWSYLFQCMG